MKTRFLRTLTSLCLVLTLALSVGLLASCDETPEEPVENEASINDVYVMAQEAGYEGTLEELIALFKGETGAAGVAGVGVAGASVNAEGHLIMTLTDGTEVDCGAMPGVEGGVISGVGIKDATINADGHLILTLTDDRPIDCGLVAVKGEKGDTGVGISGVSVNAKGEIIVTLTDGNQINAGMLPTTGAQGPAGADGAPGAAGKDGVGIKGATINSEGHLIITLTEGEPIDAGKVVTESAGSSAGTPGKDGKDGRSVTEVKIDDDGYLWVYFSDNTSTKCGKVVGADGENGAPGQDGAPGAAGQNGVGISNVTLDKDGYLIITLTDKNEYKLGPITGSGTQGPAGPAGVGIDRAEIDENGHLILYYTDDTVVDCGKVVGDDGQDGAPGQNGAPGAPGQNGAPGQDGAPGEKGTGIEKVYIENGHLYVRLDDGSEPIDCGALPTAEGEEEPALDVTVTLRSELSGYETVQIVKSGSYLKLPILELEGYTFAGWFYRLEEDGVNAAQITNLTPINTNMEITAKWIENKAEDEDPVYAVPELMGAIDSNGNEFDGRITVGQTTEVTILFYYDGEMTLDGMTSGGIEISLYDQGKTSDESGRSLYYVTFEVYASYAGSFSGNITFRYGDGGFFDMSYEMIAEESIYCSSCSYNREIFYNGLCNVCLSRNYQIDETILAGFAFGDTQQIVNYAVGNTDTDTTWAVYFAMGIVPTNAELMIEGNNIAAESIELYDGKYYVAIFKVPAMKSESAELFVEYTATESAETVSATVYVPVVVLSSEEEDHECKFGDSYDYDEREHWPVCGCGAIGGSESHYDNDGEGACDVCGYDMNKPMPPYINGITEADGGSYVGDTYYVTYPYDEVLLRVSVKLGVSIDNIRLRVTEGESEYIYPNFNVGNNYADSTEYFMYVPALEVGTYTIFFDFSDYSTESFTFVVEEPKLSFVGFKEGITGDYVRHFVYDAPFGGTGVYFDLTGEAKNIRVRLFGTDNDFDSYLEATLMSTETDNGCVLYQIALPVLESAGTYRLSVTIDDTEVASYIVYVLAEGEHVCEYDYDNWTYDDACHWHAAICGCEIITDNEGHSFDEKGTCSVCGYHNPDLEKEVSYLGAARVESAVINNTPIYVYSADEKVTVQLSFDGAVDIERIYDDRGNEYTVSSNAYGDIYGYLFDLLIPEESCSYHVYFTYVTNKGNTLTESFQVICQYEEESEPVEYLGAYYELDGERIESVEAQFMYVTSFVLLFSGELRSMDFAVYNWNNDTVYGGWNAAGALLEDGRYAVHVEIFGLATGEYTFVYRYENDGYVDITVKVSGNVQVNYTCASCGTLVEAPCYYNGIAYCAECYKNIAESEKQEVIVSFSAPLVGDFYNEWLTAGETEELPNFADVYSADHSGYALDKLIFAGWVIGDKVYQPGDSYTFDEDTTIEAMLYGYALNNTITGEVTFHGVSNTTVTLPTPEELGADETKTFLCYATGMGYGDEVGTALESNEIYIGETFVNLMSIFVDNSLKVENVSASDGTGIKILGVIDGEDGMYLTSFTHDVKDPFMVLLFISGYTAETTFTATVNGEAAMTQHMLLYDCGEFAAVMFRIDTTSLASSKYELSFTAVSGETSSTVAAFPLTVSAIVCYECGNETDDYYYCAVGTVCAECYEKYNNNEGTGDGTGGAVEDKAVCAVCLGKNGEYFTTVDGTTFCEYCYNEKYNGSSVSDVYRVNIFIDDIFEGGIFYGEIKPGETYTFLEYVDYASEIEGAYGLDYTKLIFYYYVDQATGEHYYPGDSITAPEEGGEISLEAYVSGVIICDSLNGTWSIYGYNEGTELDLNSLVKDATIFFDDEMVVIENPETFTVSGSGTNFVMALSPDDAIVTEGDGESFVCMIDRSYATISKVTNTGDAFMFMMFVTGLAEDASLSVEGIADLGYDYDIEQGEEFTYIMFYVGADAFAIGTHNVGVSVEYLTADGMTYAISTTVVFDRVEYDTESGESGDSTPSEGENGNTDDPTATAPEVVGINTELYSEPSSMITVDQYVGYQIFIVLSGYATDCTVEYCGMTLTTNVLYDEKAGVYYAIYDLTGEMNYESTELRVMTHVGDKCGETYSFQIEVIPQQTPETGDGESAEEGVVTDGNIQSEMLKVEVTLEDEWMFDNTYSFIAKESGVYNLWIPAGLGLYSMEAFMNGNIEEVPYAENTEGTMYTVSLEAGQEYVFIVGSLTCGVYNIVIEYVPGV